MVTGAQVTGHSNVIHTLTDLSREIILIFAHEPHAVLSALRVHPTLQLLHMAAPFFVHPAPVWGEPFRQVHLFAVRARVSEHNISVRE